LIGSCAFTLFPDKQSESIFAISLSSLIAFSEYLILTEPGFDQQKDNKLDDIYQQKQFVAQETRVSLSWEPTQAKEKCGSQVQM